MKPVRYRFTITDFNGGEVGGWANTLFSIKKLLKHFDFKKEVRIVNNRKNKVMILK